MTSQIQLIRKIQKYNNYLKKNRIDLTKSSFAHLTSWVKNPGYIKLKFIQKKYDLETFLLLVKFLLLTIVSSNKISIYPPKKILKDKIILSWCIKEDFNSNGKYRDRYFGISNKESKSFYWLLISVDNYIPKKLADNISIISLSQKKSIINFFFFIKRLFKIVIINNFSISKIFHYLFYITQTAEILSEKIRNVIKIDKIKIILLPYEAQPFQKIIIKDIRAANSKSKIFGYIHSSLPALPSEFIYNELYAPDILYCHGRAYQNILNKFLHWPKYRIKIIKSLKYQFYKSKDFKPNIYLPYELNNEKLLSLEFEEFLKKQNKYNFNKQKVIIHPSKINTKKHIKFMDKISDINNKYISRKKFMFKRIPIFFGSTTIFEGLEIYSEVIHICSDPVFEGLNENFWPYIRIKKFSNHVFSYKLLKSGEYIIFGNKTIKNNFINSINL